MFSFHKEILLLMSYLRSEVRLRPWAVSVPPTAPCPAAGQASWTHLFLEFRVLMLHLVELLHQAPGPFVVVLGHLLDCCHFLLHAAVLLLLLLAQEEENDPVVQYMEMSLLTYTLTSSVTSFPIWDTACLAVKWG